MNGLDERAMPDGPEDTTAPPKDIPEASRTRLNHGRLSSEHIGKAIVSRPITRYCCQNAAAKSQAFRPHSVSRTVLLTAATLSTQRLSHSSTRTQASIQAGASTRHNSTPAAKHSASFGKRTSSGTGPTTTTTAALPPTDPTRSATPKSTKRRQVIASQDLRSNPPPTRGPLLQCIAYSTAERYDLDKLAKQLRELNVKWSTALEEASNTGALGVPGISASSDQAIVISDWNTTNVLEDTTYEDRDHYQVASDLSHPELLNDNGGSSSTPTARHRALASFDQGQNGEIWVFRSGSFVTWGLTPGEGRRFLREVIRNPATVIEVGTLKFDRVQTEEVDFVVDPTEETRIKGNLILLGRAPELQTFTPSPTYAALLTRYTLSLSLARSSALSALEAKLDAHLESVSRVPHMLEVWGKQPLGRKEVIRKIGELMVLREAVNFRGGGLEDTPEIYWSEPQLEAYFDAVSTEFEMKERIDTINQKIDYASEVQSTLRALLTEASGHRMELIIIALIAVEVVFVLVREGGELSHKIGELFESLVTPIKAIDHTLSPTAGDVGDGEIAGLPIERESVRAGRGELRESRSRLV